MCLLIEVAIYGAVVLAVAKAAGLLTEASWWVVLLVGAAAWVVVHGLFAALARRRA